MSDFLQSLCDSIVNHRYLQALILAGNLIDDSGAEYLANILPASKITSLDLTGNRIGTTSEGFLLMSFQVPEELPHLAMP